MKEKLGQEPAFSAENLGPHSYSGMSKRFYAACAAMQGMLANSNYKDSDFNRNKESMISLCYVAADELLKQENL